MLGTTHQSVFADNQQPLGTVELCQSDLLVEGTVSPHHHGNAVREAPFWHIRGQAQDRLCQVIDLETGLKKQTHTHRYELTQVSLEYCLMTIELYNLRGCMLSLRIVTINIPVAFSTI